LPETSGALSSNQFSVQPQVLTSISRQPVPAESDDVAKVRFAYVSQSAVCGMRSLLLATTCPFHFTVTLAAVLPEPTAFE
jgi:hypothetical protein